jgi:hypothetical protein
MTGPERYLFGSMLSTFGSSKHAIFHKKVLEKGLQDADSKMALETQLEEV